MKYNGTFTLTNAGGANAARLQQVEQGTLRETVASGSLGALTKSIHRDVTVKLVSVVDTGRGHVTGYLHSANNWARIVAALTAMNGTFYYAQPSSSATTARIILSKNINGEPVAITDTVTPYDPGMDNADPENPVPLPDTRTPFELELAAMVNPAFAAMSITVLIDRVANAMHEKGVQGYIVLNEDSQVVYIYLVPNTAAVAAFQAANGVANLDANSFIGVFSVPPVAEGGSISNPFIP